MLFNRITDEQKQDLFENTAANMGNSTMKIKHRYIRNCYLRDPSYSKRVDNLSA
ncbi:catalase-related domain-containing protein [uncultured Anaerococcus sp.]|uniref:catalase-related domain-containing protein n=1 Tax=uncultured Anaerococcus sp. TaxID=293428 RepID=UPI0025CE3E92|nr:catalase-related domain-containing protein [uncultured Anaerococcus sp.]